MPVPVGYASGTSCWDKVKMGCKIGVCVGAVSASLFGGYSSFRYGLRGKQLIIGVGKLMVQGSLTFATFMGIASAIRC